LWDLKLNIRITGIYLNNVIVGIYQLRRWLKNKEKRPWIARLKHVRNYHELLNKWNN
jgi:hypothetical protein